MIGIFITDVEKPIIHPQTEDVLRRSRKDFEKVYLWTAVNVDRAYLALLSFCLEEYFDMSRIVFFANSLF